MRTRRERLRAAISEGDVIGHVPKVYSRLAKETPSEAAEFLVTATKFYNPMPHGICRMNWALEPCPHSLSCFSCGSDDDGRPTPCEHLIVDCGDKGQVAEIEQINRNAGAVKRIIEEEGAVSCPQYEKFDLVQRSTEKLLSEICQK